jgi:hypothetical protein
VILAGEKISSDSPGLLGVYHFKRLAGIERRFEYKALNVVCHGIVHAGSVVIVPAYNWNSGCVQKIATYLPCVGKTLFWFNQVRTT